MTDRYRPANQTRHAWVSQNKVQTVYTLAEWFCLPDEQIQRVVSSRVSTAVIYLNGTRRWFLSRSDNWADYAEITCQAQRTLNQYFYNFGIETLIQPVLGYDLLSRGPDYMNFAIEQGLGALTSSASREWYHQNQIRVAFYGNWATTLVEHGFPDVMANLQNVMAETKDYTKHKLLFGIFSDEGLKRIIALARQVESEACLLSAYYGQPVGPVNLIIGSGQPAIWDIPLLNVNQASMYFLQAPTFCLTQTMLREMLYDHLYQRKNDDELYENLPADNWQDFKVLGVGRQTYQGWEAV